MLHCITTAESRRIRRRAAQLRAGWQGRNGFGTAALRGAGDRLHDHLVAQAFLPRRVRAPLLPDAAGHVVDLQRELVARVDLRHLLHTVLAFPPEDLQALALVGEGILHEETAALAREAQRLLLVRAVARLRLRQEARGEAQGEAHALLHLAVALVSRRAPGLRHDLDRFLVAEVARGVQAVEADIRQGAAAGELPAV